MGHIQPYTSTPELTEKKSLEKERERKLSLKSSEQRVKRKIVPQEVVSSSESGISVNLADSDNDDESLDSFPLLDGTEYLIKEDFVMIGNQNVHCFLAIETSGDSSAAEAIKTIIKYHEEQKDNNGKVCIMGKYHNILYVAVKLCYVWQIKDSDTVSLLLKEIYKCESTFERILIGAIFGNKAPHFIAGWKSDFDSEEENLRAVVYFLDKANQSKLKLNLSISNQVVAFRFIDLPIESCGKASALKICIQLGLPDKLLIFLRFGARVFTENEDVTVLEHILNRLLEFNHVYPYNLVCCLQLLLRAVDYIKIDRSGELSHQILIMEMREKYGCLVEDGLLPPQRCGITPPELKHLCRCVIRNKLWENYQLPNGIRMLHLPNTMWRYLDLLED